MLLKTNSFDKKFMKLALSLASERIGLTGENPSVGCVIVKDNEIISTGQTGYHGRPHAEINAIKSCKKNLKGSSIYISLEPCCHYGKTPPCTLAIINSKIKKVYYAIDDIDERTSRKSYNILKKKKIKVFKNVLKNEAKNIYKSYFFNKTKKFPYITGKLAVSKNFIINSTKKYITNKYSREYSHLLRYKNEAILISSKTLNNDDPILNCRIKGLEKFSPTRIIVDSKLRIKLNSKIVKSAKKYKTIIFYSLRNKKYHYLKKKGVYLYKCPLIEKKKMDLKFILKKIKFMRINFLLVEGGKNLTSEFLKEKYFNEFYLFKSNILLNHKKKMNVSILCSKLSKIFKKNQKVNTYLENDILYKYN